MEGLYSAVRDYKVWRAILGVWVPGSRTWVQRPPPPSESIKKASTNCTLRAGLELPRRRETFCTADVLRFLGAGFQNAEIKRHASTSKSDSPKSPKRETFLCSVVATLSTSAIPGRPRRVFFQKLSRYVGFSWSQGFESVSRLVFAGFWIAESEGV